MKPRTSPEKEAEVIRRYRLGERHDQIGPAVGIGASSIYKILERNSIPLRVPPGANLSPAQRAMLVRVAENPGGDGPTIVASGTYADLAILNEQRLVRWTEPSRGQVRDVRLTKMGSKALPPGYFHAEIGHTSGRMQGRTGDSSDYRTLSKVADGGPITRRHVAPEPATPDRTAPVVAAINRAIAPTVQARDWPILTELLAREDRALNVAETLATAANALPADDPLRVVLLARADDELHVKFSAVEAEYLRRYRNG